MIDPAGPATAGGGRRRAGRRRTGELALAADAFVVRTADGPDVVAGYPWFGAWSRDTMTSYEGLFLTTGRADEGRELLRAYAATLSEGMLANTADTGSVEYNTADATLLVPARGEPARRPTGDTDLAAELLPALRGDGRRPPGAAPATASASTRPTACSPRAPPGMALTWMDARVDGVPVTPRVGKPVEVNALWINGLAGLAGLAGRLGRDAGAARARRAGGPPTRSGRRFPAPAGWLYDVVDGRDAATTPTRARPTSCWPGRCRTARCEPDPVALRRLGRGRC